VLKFPEKFCESLDEAVKISCVC